MPSPVEVSNNLSYPILEFNSGGASGTIGGASTSVTAGVFGTNFSYGCPETDPLADYPNKSCVSSTGVFYDKYSSECLTLCKDPNIIERMYWQKVPGQKWKSEMIGPRLSETAAYVDWGDALESRTVSATPVARAETMPFSEEDSNMQGFEMWHVFGTGKTEMWGARVTDSASSRITHTHPRTRSFTPAEVKKPHIDRSKEEKFGKIISNSLQRLRKTIGSILDLSVLESGRLVFRKELIQMDELVLQITAGMRLLTEKKGLALINHVNQKLPGIIGDKDEIQRVVTNLIDNAIKYTERGEIHVFLEQKDVSIEFAVKDTGIGIGLPTDQFGKLFERFFRNGQELTAPGLVLPSVKTSLMPTKAPCG